MNDKPILSKGKMKTHSTGAKREDKGARGRPTLISVIALERLAKHLEKGADKHGSRNWEKGLPLSTYLDALFRHLLQLIDGCEDEDHAAAIAFNIDGYMHTEHLIKCGALPSSLDDMPRHQNLLKKFLTSDDSPPKTKAVGDFTAALDDCLPEKVIDDETDRIVTEIVKGCGKESGKRTMDEWYRDMLMDSEVEPAHKCRWKCAVCGTKTIYPQHSGWCPGCRKDGQWRAV